MNADIVVLCVGNLLAGDDGVGVHVADALRPGQSTEVMPGGTVPGGALPGGVRVVDGGTIGLELLSVIEDARALVIVDAVELRAPPGTVRVLEGPALHAALARHMSVHQVAVADLLALGRLTGRLPERVAMVGVQPATFEPSMELSGPVAAALPVAMVAVHAVVTAFAAETDLVAPNPGPGSTAAAVAAGAAAVAAAPAA